MVQNTASTGNAGSRRRGRPPKFDRDAVIDAAIGAFWDRGLEGTTLPDLEAATGIDRSTLYGSFGGKQGLYELATARYLDNAEAQLFEPLLDGTDDGLADVTEFLDRLKAGLTSAERPGCLVINNIARDDATRPGDRPGDRYRRVLRQGLVAALGRADEIAADTVEQRAGLLAASVIGINLISKAGSDVPELGLLVDGVIAHVQSWADVPPSD